MTIDPALYTNDGSTAIAGLRLTANYNPSTGEGLSSEVINDWGGETQYREPAGVNSKFGIDVGSRTATDIVTLKIGGIAILTSTSEGVDPLELIAANSSYTIKHIATCTQ